MFAGRYLKWNAIAVACYLFFSFYLYYVSWLIVHVSGCATVLGGCRSVESGLNDVVRPYGLLAACVLVITSGVLRIHFLKLNPLWCLALLVWVGAASGFLFGLGPQWFAGAPFKIILADFPLDLLFLVVMIAFLCFPVEFYQSEMSGGQRLSAAIAGFSAAYAVIVSLLNSPLPIAMIRSMFRSETLAAQAVAMQTRLLNLLLPTGSGLVPLATTLALFALSLLAVLIARRAPPQRGAFTTLSHSSKTTGW